MNVGVLGSGEVGRALASGFASRGHDVVVGSRSPDKDELVSWREQAGEHGSTGSFREAAEHGELVVLAVQGAAAESVLELAGHDALAGKVLIDVTNPLAFEDDGPPGLFVGTTDSLAETIQRAVPQARVVKAFNTVPNTQMVDPAFQGPTPEMLICGDDPGAKKQVEEVLVAFGWPGVLDVGDLTGARWLEALVALWVRVGGEIGTFDHAWRVARPA